MKVTYDQETDALYIEFRPLNPGEARCHDLSKDVTVDFDLDGKLAGIEVFDATSIMGEKLDRITLEIGSHNTGNNPPVKNQVGIRKGPLQDPMTQPYTSGQPDEPNHSRGISQNQ